MLLNRRGYSTAVFCRQCGDTFECPNCSVSLTVHTARATAGARAVTTATTRLMVPKTCRQVRGAVSRARRLRHREGRAAAARAVSGCAHRPRRSRLGPAQGRADAAAVAVRRRRARRAGRHADDRQGARLSARHARRRDLRRRRARPGRLPRGERTFQLLTQVAGRAGRGERAGEAVVQTLYPEHYSIQLACRQDYPAFFEREIVYRRGMRYPPFVALDQRRRARANVRRGDAARRRDIVRRLEPATARRNVHHPRARRRRRSAACAASTACSFPEGHAPRRHAQRAEGGACRDAGDPAADDDRRRSAECVSYEAGSVDADPR